MLDRYQLGMDRTKLGQDRTRTYISALEVNAAGGAPKLPLGCVTLMAWMTTCVVTKANLQRYHQSH
jgi:hypothetical protein